MAERSMTLRIQIDDRTVDEEDGFLVVLRKTLAILPGDPRPTLQISRAAAETVACEVIGSGA